MRSVLTILLAFAAGVLVTLWLPGRPGTPSLPEHHPADLPPASASMSPGVSYAAGFEADSEGDDWPPEGPTPEQVLYAQPRLLRDALARVTPRIAGKPNLYLLTFAGDGAEDVFHNEAEYAAKLFTTRFGATAHSLVLENNPATLTSHPLASWSNLDAALAGLGKLMRPEQDILLLYISSHGSEDHTLLVDMDPLPLDQIGAQDLAGILAMHPFKWKVVVINACYSGGFVPPLRAPDTLVLAAARTDRSSFGCGSDSDITYFGKAWLVDALNHTDNFVDAFRQASSEIRQWERQDKLTPSEPQIDIGIGIENQLALWRKGFTPGPAVAFKPPVAAPAAAATTTK
ncbi:C13 family peptidase [Rhodanobacter ginsengisoli]|uniref:C13 family peptidase n=1 Tax=Rhodanobacter ginsengisoli TaxID=418646 RepID=A0ABW0QKV8_9GAMM